MHARPRRPLTSSSPLRLALLVALAPVASALACGARTDLGLDVLLSADTSPANDAGSTDDGASRDGGALAEGGSATDGGPLPCPTEVDTTSGTASCASYCAMASCIGCGNVSNTCFELCLERLTNPRFDKLCLVCAAENAKAILELLTCESFTPKPGPGGSLLLPITYSVGSCGAVCSPTVGP